MRTHDYFYAPFSKDTKEFLRLGNYIAIIDLIELCRDGCINKSLIDRYYYKDKNGNLKINNILDEIRWILVMNNFL